MEKNNAEKKKKAGEGGPSSAVGGEWSLRQEWQKVNLVRLGHLSGSPRVHRRPGFGGNDIGQIPRSLALFPVLSNKGNKDKKRKGKLGSGALM